MKIQLKRSGILDGDSAKAPSSEQMDYGELAVNYNVDDPAIFLKDSDDNIVRLAGQSSVGGNLQAVTDAGNNTTNQIDVFRKYENRDDLAQQWGYNTSGTNDPANNRPSAMVTAKGSFYSTDSGDVSITNYKTLINANGSAAFTGLVNIGSDGANPEGHTLYTNGVQYSRRDGDGVAIYRGYKTGNPNPTVEINNDGSAAFTSEVQVRNLNVNYRQERTGAIFQGYDGAVDGDPANFTSQINSDGSATFASTVKQGTFNGGQINTSGSVLLDGGGVYTQCLPSETASSKRMLRIYHGDNENTTIFADGSATFAGTVTTTQSVVGLQGGEVRVYGDYVSSTSGTGGVHLTYDNSNKQSMITAGSNDGNTPTLAFAFPGGGQDPKANTGIVFNQGGSAQFKSEIKVEGDSTPSGRSSRISKYGSLLIGTTSDSISAARFSVDAGNGNVASIGSVTLQRANGGDAAIEIGYSSLSQTIILKGNGSIQGNENGSANTNPLYKLDGNGDITAVNFNSTSDATLKMNINPIDNAIDMIKEITGVTFDWKHNEASSIGVLAQDVETVAPELVANGQHKTVNYNGIVGILVEAVKELSAEVQALKEKN